MKFEIFKSPANSQWFWRLVAVNGKSIAIGGEGYHNRTDCVSSLNLVRQHAATATAYEQRPDGTWFIPA
jgi:uncharacterized protein